MSRHRPLRCWAAAQALCLATIGGCGSSAFDNLTLIEDPTIAAPRPLSPISVSWIPSARPILRWQLNGDLGGAVVDLCRTRGCATIERTYTRSGSELRLPDDLAAGFWFWRLRGVSRGRVGTTPSVTWEFYVRGPGAAGSSSSPRGAILDLNGDGFVDLTAIGISSTGPILYVYLGKPDGALPEEPDWQVPLEPLALPDVTVAGGIDVNGDGFADVAIGLRLPADATTPELSGSTIVYGGEVQATLAPFPVVLDGYPRFGRSLAAGGDVNGDGYGDFVIGTRSGAFTFLGASTPRLWALRPILTPQAEEVALDTGGRSVVGACDLTGNGRVDVFASSYDDGLLFGSPQLAGGVLKGENGAVYAPLLDDDATTQATTLTAGDYDGDGISDLTAIAGGVNDTLLCTVHGDPKLAIDSSSLVALPTLCTRRPGIATTTSSTAVDLMGAGADDFLAAVSGPDGPFVEIGRDMLASPKFERVSGAYAGPLTTLLPGRLGEAGRWAALSTDGGSVAVFDGTAARAFLHLPSGASGPILGIR